LKREVSRRKVLTSNDFRISPPWEHYLLAFQHRYQAMAQPFRWTFTRGDLQQLLVKLAAVRPAA
jgi:hypothetical protein